MSEVVRLKGQPAPFPEDDEEKIRQFFLQPYIEVRNLDRAIATRARTICRTPTETGKKMPVSDAIHVATALELGIRELHTFDDEHLTPFSGIFGEAGYQLEICYPKYSAAPPVETLATTPSDQRGLFDESPIGVEDAEITEEIIDADAADEGLNEEAAVSAEIRIDGRHSEEEQAATSAQDREVATAPKADPAV